MGIVRDALDAFAGQEDPVDVVVGKVFSEFVIFEADGFEEEGGWYVGRSVLDDCHAMEAVGVESGFEFGREG